MCPWHSYYYLAIRLARWEKTGRLVARKNLNKTVRLCERTVLCVMPHLQWLRSVPGEPPFLLLIERDGRETTARLEH